MEKKQLNIRLPIELNDRLDNLSKITKITKQGIIELMLVKKLDEIEKKLNDKHDLFIGL